MICFDQSLPTGEYGGSQIVFRQCCQSCGDRDFEPALARAVYICLLCESNTEGDSLLTGFLRCQCLSPHPLAGGLQRGMRTSAMPCFRSASRLFSGVSTRRPMRVTRIPVGDAVVDRANTDSDGPRCFRFRERQWPGSRRLVVLTFSERRSCRPCFQFLPCLRCAAWRRERTWPIYLGTRTFAVRLIRI